MQNTEILKVTESNLFETINSGIFGSIVIDFDNNETKQLMENAIETYNTIRRSSVVMRPNEEGENYQLMFTREYVEESLNPDDILLYKAAGLSRDNCSEIGLTINPLLYPLARKIARSYGIKFTGTSFKFEVKESIIDKIRFAYLSGDSKIELNISETSIHTARAYCAILKNQYNTVMQCKIENDKIIIWFRNPTVQEQALSSFKKSLTALVSTGVISKNTGHRLNLEVHTTKSQDIKEVQPETEEEAISGEYITLEDEIDEDDF